MVRPQIYRDLDCLVDGAAEFIADLAVGSIAARGRFTMALAGGSTPRPVYAKLAEPACANRIDWNKVQVFFGDERCVPPEDPRSNYQMARAALLDHVPLPAANIYRMHGEEPPVQAALLYEAELRACFGGNAAAGQSRADGFDLVLLGMGDNGHTASIFPGLAAVTEPTRWVLAQYVEVMEMWRVTLTPPVINAARHVAFLVSGAGKAEMLRRVLEGPYDPVVLPSQVIRPTGGDLHWLVDEAAAALLKP
jgi:6-phosphogluconolactonase